MTFRNRPAFGAAAALCGAALVAGCASGSSVPAGGQRTASGARASSAATAATAPASGTAAPASPAASCAASAGGSGGAWSAPGASFTVPSLAAVQFAGAHQGWVAGAGRILATRDGGATWTSQYRGPDDLVQVDFTDASHGWAVGTSELLRTSDGGATWTPLAEPCAGRVRSVHFISASLGYAVAGGSQVRLDGGVPAPVNGGELLATSDGGTTWHAVAGAPAGAQTACFTSAADGYLGTPGAVWRTTDGGSHWSRSFREAAPAKGIGQPAPDTTVLECAGPGAAWVLFLGVGAAMGHAPYLGYATRDGLRWRAVFEERYTESAAHPEVRAPQGPGSYPGPFSAISPEQAVFVGFTPPIGYGAAPVELAGDAGATLTSEGMVRGLTTPQAAAFISPAQGWVVGTDQTQPGKPGDFVIVATADGGRSWTTQYRSS